MNKVILIGYLGQDPTARTKAATVSIATTTRTRRGEITDWHTLVFFGKVSEIALQHLHRGSLVSVVGELKHTKYEKDGKTIYSTYVAVRELEMLGKKVNPESAPDDHVQHQDHGDYEDDDLPI